MHEFFVDQLDYVLFLCGLSFVLLSAQYLLLRKTPQQKLRWNWLALFSLIQGLDQWVSAAFAAFDKPHELSETHAFLIILSFVCLIEFNRQMLNQLKKRTALFAYVPFLCWCALNFPPDPLLLASASQYLLGLPAIIWSAFTIQRKEVIRQIYDRVWLTIAVTASFTYAIFAGLIVERPLLNIALPFSETNFFLTFGIPVQVFRALLALVFSLAAWRHFENSWQRLFASISGKQTKRKFFPVSVLLLLVLILGWLATRHLGKLEEKQLRAELISYSASASLQLEPAVIRLTENNSKSSFQQIERQLGKWIDVHAHIVRTHLLVLEDGRVFYKAISVSSPSQDAPTAQSEYQNPPKELLQVWSDLKPAIAEPAKNRKARYVSCFTPLMNEKGDIIAVIGTDLKASYWLKRIAFSRLAAIFPSLLLSLLLLGSIIVRELLWCKERKLLASKSALISLAKSYGSQDELLQRLTSVAAHTVGTERASIWTLTEDRQYAVCADLYTSSTDQHEQGYKLAISKFPSYLQALQQDRVIATGEARTDPRARELRKDYLEPNNIYSMLDVLILQNGEASGLFSFEHVDKERQWTEEDISFAVGLADILSVHREREERRAAEDALRTSEEMFRCIGTAANDGIIMMDDLGKIVFWNQAAERIFGYSHSEAVGKDLHQLIAPPDYHKHFYRGLTRWENTGDGESVGRTVELKGINKQGEPVFVELSLSSVKVKQRWQAVGIARDIGGRKKAEKALSEAKIAAEIANRAKSEFLANMSHEIRTPMGGIIGMTDLALSTQLTSEQREYLEAVQASAKSLLVIINDILDYSKIEAGKLPINRGVFHLREFIARVTSLVGPRASVKGLSIISRIDNSIEDELIGDETRIGQVLLNLLSNAVKFTGSDGTILLTVTKELQPTDKEFVLHFSVKDTGIGIAPENTEKIFEPFTQADGSVSRVFGGTGLGLTISKHLVELMGGQIWVESSPGKGSLFQFTAPVSQVTEESETASSDEMHEDLCGDGMFILVVEDNPVNQKLLEHLLRKHKFSVDIAENGQRALDLISRRSKAKENRYNAILMDCQMPIMDGFTATAEIRKLEELDGATRVPIVALTAHAMDGDCERCLAAGMDHYVSKPINTGQLLEILWRCCSSKSKGKSSGRPPSTER